VIREGERLNQLLREDDKEVVPFLSGRKGIAYYTFRQREIAQSWSGDSDAPSFARAKEMADALIEAFLTPTEEGGVDEIHIVFTRFVSMLTQRPDVIRLLPLEVVEGEEAPEPDDVLPLYEFEPSAEEVLDGLLPKYVASRIHYCMLQAAASELASRQRAMKSATDNAQDLIEALTREFNQARQAQITQEISEIVGGAGALADANAGSE
jgi:F-type H+-transporting ATPase subunit gamma